MDKKEKQLREEIGSLSEQLKGIEKEAQEDGRESLNEDESKRWDDTYGKVEDKRKELDRHLKSKKLEDEMNRNATPITGSANGSSDTDIEVGENRKDSWEMRVVRYFNALATGKDDQSKSFEMIRSLTKEYKDIPHRQVEDERKQALKTIGDSELSRDKKRMARYALGINTRLMTTSTTDTAQAGNLLPKPFLAEVFVLIEQYGVARRLFRSIPMTSKDLDLKNISTKVVAFWTDEGANIEASDLVVDPGVLEASKLAGLTNWTTELSEDQAIALLPIVMDCFAESIAQKEDQAAFIGDGTATYGGYTGLLNLTNAQVETFGTGSVAGTDLDESHIRSMKASVSTASRMGARWFMEYSVLDHISQLENSAGFRLFPNAFRDGQPGLILGDPVTMVDVMPKIGDVAADTPFVVYGNPNRALFGLRRGMTADISREAVVQNAAGDIVYNAFQGDGAILRLTERVGIKVPAAFEPSFAVAATAAS